MLGAWLAACASTKVAPLTESGSAYLAEEDERSMVRQANDYERQLREKGMVFEDTALQEYVDSVGRKLVPPLVAQNVQFHFAVLRDPSMNAFSLLQGGIYVHAGLLARLDNEAQLAHVLGHEITHTVKRHQLKFVRSMKNKTVAAKLAEILLAPAAGAFAGGGGASLVSSLIGLTYAASVTGYGRENEEEADLEGLRLMAAAGYRAEEAPRMFALLTEVEDPGALEIFFYGSHPANETRTRYVQELIDRGTVTSAGDAVTNPDAYQRVTTGLARENIKLRLDRGHYQYALDEALASMRRRGEDPWLHYYVGEAHRRTAADPEGAAREQAMRHREPPQQALIDSFRARAPEEQAAALTAYHQALKMDPALSAAHRGIGLVAYQQGDKETARRELAQYLAASQKATDRRYIERILEEMK